MQRCLYFSWFYYHNQALEPIQITTIHSRTLHIPNNIFSNRKKLAFPRSFRNSPTNRLAHSDVANATLFFFGVPPEHALRYRLFPSPVPFATPDSGPGSTAGQGVAGGGIRVAGGSSGNANIRSEQVIMKRIGWLIFIWVLSPLPN